MTLNEFNFKSFNGISTVHAWCATPNAEPVGIIQLVHGLGCHSRRYLPMAKALTEAGFVVCADDHVGHGRTAEADSSFGTVRGNWRTFLEDEHTLRQLLWDRYPQLPFGMFGHSMGSMIARGYAAAYPEDGLRALALGGICQQNPGAEPLLELPEIGALIAEGRGADMALGGKYFGILMEKANVRYPEEGPAAWLSRDQGVREDYAADSLNNHVGNALDMLHAFVELYRISTDPKNDAQIPRGLPLLLMAGDQDPCGNYGEGLYNAANSLTATGHRVECTAFTGYRHEIHNHPDLRNSIHDKLICFFRRYL